MRRQIDKNVDDDVLEMALLGYRARREEVIRKMAEIEGLLGSQPGSDAASAARNSKVAAAKPKRKLSAAGRRAIRAGVKKRWAEFHAKTRAPEPAKKAPAKAKRVISSSAKAKLTANLALARAARASKRAVQQPA